MSHHDKRSFDTETERNYLKVCNSSTQNSCHHIKNHVSSKGKNVVCSCGDREGGHAYLHRSKKNRQDANNFQILPFTVSKNTDLHSDSERSTDHGDGFCNRTRHHRQCYHRFDQDSHCIRSKNAKKENAQNSRKSFYSNVNERCTASISSKKSTTLNHFRKNFQEVSPNRVSRLSSHKRDKLSYFSKSDTAENINGFLRKQMEIKSGRQMEDFNIDGSARTRVFHSKKKQDKLKILNVNSTAFGFTGANCQKKNVLPSKGGRNKCNELRYPRRDSADYNSSDHLDGDISSPYTSAESMKSSNFNKSHKFAKQNERSLAKEEETLAKDYTVKLKKESSVTLLDHKLKKSKITEERKNAVDENEKIARKKPISSPDEASSHYTKSSKSQHDETKTPQDNQPKQTTEKGFEKLDLGRSFSAVDLNEEKKSRVIKSKELYNQKFEGCSDISNTEDYNNSPKQNDQPPMKTIVSGQKGKNCGYKNRYNSKLKGRTLHCLMMCLIRRIILSENRKNKPNTAIFKDTTEIIDESNDHCSKSIRDRNLIGKKETVTISNKTESSDDSSGYNSLKNIQSSNSELNETMFSLIKRTKLCSSNSRKNGCCYSESGKNFSNGGKNQNDIDLNHKEENVLRLLHLENQGSLTEPPFVSENYLKCICSGVQFFDPTKYCVYQTCKRSDGGISLKESQNYQFKGGEYVIGKKIRSLDEINGCCFLNEPMEFLFQFSENMEKNRYGIPGKKCTDSNCDFTVNQRTTIGPVNQKTSKDQRTPVDKLHHVRENATQTELSMSIKMHDTRRGSWIGKTSTRCCKDVLPKHCRILRSVSNTSTGSKPETSEEFGTFYDRNMNHLREMNLPVHRNGSAHYSQSSKTALVQLPEPPQHCLKTSMVEDTRILDNYVSVKESDETLEFGLNDSPEKYRSIDTSTKLNRDWKLPTNDVHCVYDAMKIKDPILDPGKINMNFRAPMPPSMIPVSWLKQNKFGFNDLKNDIQSTLEVQDEDNTRFFQPNEIKTEKSESIKTDCSSHTSPKANANKGLSRKFCKIFGRRKKDARIASKEKIKVKMKIFPRVRRR